MWRYEPGSKVCNHIWVSQRLLGRVACDCIGNRQATYVRIEIKQSSKMVCKTSEQDSLSGQSPTHADADARTLCHTRQQRLTTTSRTTCFSDPPKLKHDPLLSPGYVGAKEQERRSKKWFAEKQCARRQHSCLGCCAVAMQVQIA